MPSQKRKLPLYRKLLSLYPKSYQRQYKTQMLDLANDMLDAPSKSDLGTWLRILGDYIQSLPHQWVAHHQRQYLHSPKRFVRKQLLWIIALLAPLAAALFAPPFYSSDDYPANDFDAFISHPDIITIWLKILPFIAITVAIYTVAIWLSTRGMVIRGYKKRRAPVVLISIALLLALLGASFGGFITAMQIADTRMLERQKEVSLQAEADNPSLACTLLPTSTAKNLLGDKAYLNNKLTGGSFKGMYEVMDTTVGQCNYYTGNMLEDMLRVIIAQPDTQAAEQQLKQNFYDPVIGMRDGVDEITISGQRGYLTTNSSIRDRQATIEVWAEGHAIIVHASTFEIAYSAAETVVQNLKDLNPNIPIN